MSRSWRSSRGCVSGLGNRVMKPGYIPAFLGLVIRRQTDTKPVITQSYSMAVIWLVVRCWDPLVHISGKEAESLSET